jgi:hypothetical protein
MADKQKGHATRIERCKSAFPGLGRASLSEERIEAGAPTAPPEELS